MMLRPCRVSVPVIALLCFASSAGAAERLAVLPFSGTNVHPGYLQSAQELLIDHLKTTARFQTVAISGEPAATEMTAAESAEAGRAAGTDLVVSGHLIRLQSLVRVRITVYRVADAQQVFVDSLSSSGGPDQLDPVLRRLASAIVTGERAENNAEIDSVTESESDPYLKKTATKTIGLKLGVLAPLQRPGHDSSVAAPVIGVFWLYDARTFLGEIFADLATRENLHAVNIGIAAYYPFSRQDNAPYLGGGLAWSVTDFGGQGANGLRAHGALGMLLGRLSSVQIRGELGYFVNLFSERVGSVLTRGPIGTEPESVVSHGPMLSVGLGI